jgi:PleD family two-component response regulator
MIQVRSKNVLLVAPDTFSVELLPNNKQFKHISSTSRIFPAIHEQKPNLVILDYDHLNADIEKILRRLQSNPAYNKIKICCYKQKEHSKVDSLLKVLGVDYIFYPGDFNKAEKGNSVINAFSNIFDVPVMALMAKASV